MKHVVVLGGGFAGVAALRELVQKKIDDFDITLIDRNEYHLFTPSLYEVATSEEPQKNVAIPFSELFGRKIHFVKGTVKQINVKEQLVILLDETILPYDYLLITLGSETAYYNIPGLQEHAVAFKVLQDALLIKQKVKTLCCKDGKYEKKVNIVIGGGGFAGTELAAELITYKEGLAKQYGLDKDCLRLTIVQGS
ncbi:MAG TPA: FAD-dependent oxidoreductase, partial [Patescibacteria group bacterium]|nr:FAD-dependent oxidoreductase [Patescibacteria group bacterium]